MVNIRTCVGKQTWSRDGVIGFTGGGDGIGGAIGGRVGVGADMS